MQNQDSRDFRQRYSRSPEIKAIVHRVRLIRGQAVSHGDFLREMHDLVSATAPRDLLFALMFVLDEIDLRNDKSPVWATTLDDMLEARDATVLTKMNEIRALDQAVRDRDRIIGELRAEKQLREASCVGASQKDVDPDDVMAHSSALALVAGGGTGLPIRIPTGMKDAYDAAKSSDVGLPARLCAFVSEVLAHDGPRTATMIALCHQIPTGELQEQLTRYGDACRKIDIPSIKVAETLLSSAQSHADSMALAAARERYLVSATDRSGCRREYGFWIHPSVAAALPVPNVTCTNVTCIATARHEIERDLMRFLRERLDATEIAVRTITGYQMWDSLKPGDNLLRDGGAWRIARDIIDGASRHISTHTELWVVAHFVTDSGVERKDSFKFYAPKEPS